LLVPLTSRARLAAATTFVLLAIGGCAHASLPSASCTFSSDSGAAFALVATSGSGVHLSQTADDESTELASMGEQTARRGALVVNGGDDATVIVVGPSEMTHVHTTPLPDLETRPCAGTELSVAAFSVPVGADVTVRGYDESEGLLFELSTVITASGSNVIAQIGTPPTKPG
jgi:hypothetical protein